jgi:tetratricopeptide (TPR) repeat protein
MSENELKDTQPSSVPGEETPAARKKFPGWLAGLVLLVFIVVGVLGGYASGMDKRYSAQSTQAIAQYMEQYQLGVQAVNAGQYEVARQHFEFIIQNYPNFPGVKSAYADLLLHMQITPTLAATSTPTITPTPDTRSIDQIYANVTALLSAPGADLCARNWDDIINQLDSIRKADSTYHAAEVDGMYYIALRNRGVCKIYPQTYEPNASCSSLNINLEGGIYDLTQAERFGPLDSNASALRTWARLYITGSSFWDQDWIQAQNYFGQVVAAMPQLSDSTCTSASERYRQALLGYAQQLLNARDWCGAAKQFEVLFAIDSPKNATAYPTATEAVNICNGDVNPPK